MGIIVNFLKQPITVGMFIPTDLEGNILEIPQYNSNEQELEKLHLKYQQAKERVIFEGFELDKRGGAKDENNYIDEEFCDGKTIEDLVEFNLTLTEYGSKQIQ